MAGLVWNCKLRSSTAQHSTAQHSTAQHLDLAVPPPPCCPAERGTLFVLLADGTLQVCGVAGAAVTAYHSLPISAVNATEERVAVHAWPHPIVGGGALLAVEAAASGVTILEAPPRQAPAQRCLGGWHLQPAKKD